MDVRAKALADAIEGVPELLDQAVTLGQIECVIGLIIASVFVGCGIHACCWARRAKEDPVKAMGYVAVALCALIAGTLIALASEGLIKSFVAPKAYAIKQLLP